MGKVLAIDVGEKRVGLATTDELRMIATPYGFVDRESSVTKIVNLIKEEDISQIVFGLPYLSSGDLGTQATDVKAFATEIEPMVSIPIAFENEILSSVEATNRLKTMGKKIQNKGEVDAMAATIILESYLNGENIE